MSESPHGVPEFSGSQQQFHSFSEATHPNGFPFQQFPMQHGTVVSQGQAPMGQYPHPAAAHHTYLQNNGPGPPFHANNSMQQMQNQFTPRPQIPSGYPLHALPGNSGTFNQPGGTSQQSQSTSEPHSHHVNPFTSENNQFVSNPPILFSSSPMNLQAGEDGMPRQMVLNGPPPFMNNPVLHPASQFHNGAYLENNQNFISTNTTPLLPHSNSVATTSNSGTIVNRSHFSTQESMGNLVSTSGFVRTSSGDIHQRNHESQTQYTFQALQPQLLRPQWQSGTPNMEPNNIAQAKQLKERMPNPYTISNPISVESKRPAFNESNYNRTLFPVRYPQRMEGPVRFPPHGPPYPNNQIPLRPQLNPYQLNVNQRNQITSGSPHPFQMSAVRGPSASGNFDKPENPSGLYGSESRGQNVHHPNTMVFQGNPTSLQHQSNLVQDGNMIAITSQDNSNSNGNNEQMPFPHVLITSQDPITGPHYVKDMNPQTSVSLRYHEGVQLPRQIHPNYSTNQTGQRFSGSQMMQHFPTGRENTNQAQHGPPQRFPHAPLPPGVPVGNFPQNMGQHIRMPFPNSHQNGRIQLDGSPNGEISGPTPVQSSTLQQISPQMRLVRHPQGQIPPHSAYSMPNYHPRQPMLPQVGPNSFAPDSSQRNPNIMQGASMAVPLQQVPPIPGKLPIPSLSTPSDIPMVSQGNLASVAFQLPTKPGLQFMSSGTYVSTRMVGSSGVITSGGVMMTGISPQAVEKVLVPWGWKRIFMNDAIVYFSPSGIQLRSLSEVKDYLLTEGTCKCGLECPLRIETSFDFSLQKLSEMVVPPATSSGGNCKHGSSTATLAQLQNSTGLSIRHVHSPVLQTKDGRKGKSKKKKPFAGVLVSQMLAAREMEKQRINQIIAREKAEHEAAKQQQQLNEQQKKQHHLDQEQKQQKQSQAQPKVYEQQQMRMQALQEQSEQDKPQRQNQEQHQHFQQKQPHFPPQLQHQHQHQDQAQIYFQQHFPHQHLSPHPNIYVNGTVSTISSQNADNLGDEELRHQNEQLSLEDEQYTPHDEEQPPEEEEEEENEHREEDVGDKTDADDYTGMENDEDGDNKEDDDNDDDIENEDDDDDDDDDNNDDYDDNDDNDDERRSEVSTPLRSVLPGMIAQSGLMNLGSVSHILRSDSKLSSRDSSRRSSLESTPQASQENPRAFSLADAMQAARRLNMEQDRIQHNEEEDEDEENEGDDGDDGDEGDDEGVMDEDDVEKEENEPLNQEESIPEEEVDDDVDELKAEEKRVEDARSDLAKNIEIRRLSCTEDGNKVLEPTFHSPEKEKKKNPLEKILSFVSGIELPMKDRDGNGSRRSSPALSGTPSPVLPNLKSRKNRQYSTLPPLPHSPPPWVLRGQPPPTSNFVSMDPMRIQNLAPQVRPPIANHQMILTAGMQFQPQPVPSQLPQQVMQLIQTVNGPMLIPLGAQHILTDSSLHPPQPQDGSSQVSPQSSSGGSSQNSSPKDKEKVRKRKAASEPVPPVNHVPILMSPGGGIMNFSGAVSQGSQLVAMSQSGGTMLQPQQVMTPNLMMNPGGQQMILQNGTLMALQPQSIIYQQLPDGTLLQVQNQIPVLQQQNHQIITAPIVLNNGGNIMGGPQFLMTPQGLMQTISHIPTQPVLSQSSPTPPKRIRETERRGGARKKTKKEISKSIEAITEERDEQDGMDQGSMDTDTSYEDAYASTSTNFSPRSSIQSNKVDSSGLNATPPHYRDQENHAHRSQEFQPGKAEYHAYQDPQAQYSDLEQLREERDVEERNLDLDSSLANSRIEIDNSLNSDEPPVQVEEEGDERFEEGKDDEERPKTEEREEEKVSSSIKKKKKRNADDIVTEQLEMEEEDSDSLNSPPSCQEFLDGDIVWGPLQGHPSWPGKVVGAGQEEGHLLVCWYGGRQLTQVRSEDLKTLSDGLEAHHRERKKGRRGRRMNIHLEKAIQEAMMELD